jgi:hypothetical protein
MKLSCDKATTLCDKSQYGEITLWERLQLGLHIFLCKKCGLYSKQNSTLSKCYKNHQQFEKQKKCGLSNSEKECMEAKLKQQK